MVLETPLYRAVLAAVIARHQDQDAAEESDSADT